MSCQKVPARLAAFCEELNKRRKSIDSADVTSVYELSFWAHYELVTIHPWADGNGRTCRLLMNLLQWEFGVLSTKVLKEDKAEYIQALIDTRESEDIAVFVDCMTRLHCQHLQTDIDQFVKSTAEEVVDKSTMRQEMVDKWSIKPSLAEKLVDILEFVANKDQITTEEIVNHFGFNPTTAKRYLRQLTEFGYMEAHGGNKNRTYSKK
jgi:Fic family protein